MDAISRYKLCIRPAQEGDLHSICELAKPAGPGMTLIDDGQVIEHKVQHSIDSFKATKKNHSEAIKNRLFFFVLENMENHEILGTAIIETSVSSKCPFYNFIIGSQVQQHHSLTFPIEQKILYLSNQYENSSILGTLYLSNLLRGQGLGQFLSRARFLFIADFPELFSDILIANMRGVFDNQGTSVFWSSVCFPFFNLDHNTAFHLYMTEGSEFIANLGPHLPIYISLLPDAVQKIIGKTHQDTTPALHVLEKEGFMFRDVIDVFDGGPIIEIKKTELKAIQHSRLMTIQRFGLGKEKPTTSSASEMIITNAKLDFRSMIGKVNVIDEDHITIEEELATMLNVSLNDRVRIYPLH